MYYIIMPAQTHGRVINGFDIFSRNKSASINYYTRKCSTKKNVKKAFVAANHYNHLI